MGFCATPDSDIFILGNCHSAFCIPHGQSFALWYVCELHLLLHASWYWQHLEVEVGKFHVACQLGSARRCELSPKLQLDLVRTKGEMYSPWCGHVGFRPGHERSFDMNEWANLSLRPRLYLNLFIGIEKPIPPWSKGCRLENKPKTHVVNLSRTLRTDEKDICTRTSSFLRWGPSSPRVRTLSFKSKLRNGEVQLP